ncbi:MAG TPA: LysR family transcriptional regulator [Stellaceae bacterium]|jgi:DNA-binding transcriptional LysR family regulator|nr:LysR family transcriptional regulator [Stellaceae bacterium]
MDRFASITAFVRVAQNGGFSAAARSLSVSTTTISDQVQALENALGVRLLNRTTRRVSLTEIGRGYYERCSQILQELAEADEVAGALQVTPRGRLRVYCHQGLSRFIAQIVTRFLGDYPEVSLDLLSGDAMIDLVQEGFDLAIMPASPPDSTLIKRTLAKWYHVLCCAPAYLETHPVPRSPADLAGHNCLRYAYSIADIYFIDPAGNRSPARLSGNLVTTSIAVMRAAAVSGLGLWLCPPYIVADLLASRALVPLLTDYGRPEMEIVALYPHRRQLSAKVRLFLDMLVDRFTAEEQWRDATAAR